MKLRYILWIECEGSVKVPVLVIDLGRSVMHSRTIHSLAQTGSYPSTGVEGCEKMFG